MINLESNGILARWFVWSCDHLPLTTAEYAEVDGDQRKLRRRKGAYYIDHGTSLCHIFWAILWVPLIDIALSSFIVVVVGAMHIFTHADFMRGHPNAGPLADVASYFIMEGIMGGIILAIGCVSFAIIGGSKTGFFKLLWQYLKGIKQHVCPLVRFGGAA